MVSIEEIKPLTRIKIKTSEETYEGEKIPSEDEKVVILKLDSGYNIGLKKNNIQSVEIISKDSQTQQDDLAKKNKELKSSFNKNLPTIKLLHTGGTIASKVDYKSGGVVASFDPEELLDLFPEIKNIANLESELAGNMQSENFRFSHFNLLAEKVFEDAKQGKTRFIITCGTDFLHYLSSALSFILKDLPVGVLVVGAQRSSDRGSSDAAMNLICATQFLVSTSFKGVGVCMHDSIEDTTCVIISGVNARKMHSSRRDAFKSINTEPLAFVSYEKKKVTINKSFPKIEDSNLPTSLPLFNESLKVGMSYAHPNMFADEISIYEKYDGLVLIGSGLGHFPIMEVDSSSKENSVIFNQLNKLTKLIPVVMSPQTIFGQINMNVYTPQRLLQKAGVLGHLSTMTPETTWVKLSWLLSNFPKEQVSELLMKNLVGELNETSSNNFC